MQKPVKQIHDMIEYLQRNPNAFNQKKPVFWYYTSFGSRQSLTKFKVDREGYWQDIIKVSCSVKTKRGDINTSMPQMIMSIDPIEDWALLKKELKSTVEGVKI